MKKLFVSLVVFATFLGTAFAAEPSISGSLKSTYEFFLDNGGQKGTINELRVKVSVPIGEYVDLVMDLRDDKNSNNFFSFTEVSATSDISGALGIDPIGIKLKFGRFTTNMDNGNGKDYVRGGTDLTGKNDALVVTQDILTEKKGLVKKIPSAFKGGTADASLDIGIMDYVTLLTYASFDDSNFQYKFGLKLGDLLDGLNFVVSYGGESTGKDSYIKSDFGYELKLGDDLSITFPAAVRYVLKAGSSGYKEGSFLWSTGVKFAGFGVKLDAIFSSNKDSTDFGAIDTSVSYTIGDFTAKVTPTIKVHDPNEPVDKVDLKLTYAVMDTTIDLGFVFDLNSYMKSGPYVATKVSY